MKPIQFQPFERPFGEVQLRFRELAWRIAFVVHDDLDGHGTPPVPSIANRGPGCGLPVMVFTSRTRERTKRAARQPCQSGPFYRVNQRFR